MPDSVALPVAPSPSGSGAGQYDNKSHGGGGGGIMSHITYEGGGGFNAPTSDSSPYITWGWNFTVGAGYRFNQHLALNLEYQFIHSKIPGAIIAQAGATGGYAHIWSFTLDPTYDFNPKSAVEFYATGGGGFFRKVTSFTNPQLAQYCTYFYCGVVTQNVVVGHFSSNQGGWSIGGGIQHRFAGWNGDGKTRIFAEARYLDVLTPPVTTQPNGLGTTTVGEDTKIIPVTVGVRF
ncbi:MAG: outer membrane beta-barrel protein [Terracidiphilus sp.]